MLVLAIESSTSSAKAMLYDSEKGVVKEAKCTYDEAVVRIGMTDVEKVYELTMKMAREAAAGEDVAAIALCGIWHGLAVCDEALTPVAPFIAWNFTGTADICEEMRKDKELTEWIYQTTGCMPNSTYPRHSLTYLKQKGMNLEDKKVITQGGYNFFRLTGEFLETACTHSGSGLINIKEKDYDEGVLEYLGIKRDQLGELSTYADVRPLSQEGAKALGLAPGIPVVPSHSDGALNQVGNYANMSGRMTFSVGTSGAMRMVVDRPTLPKGGQLWCYCGVDKWISGAAVSGACNCVDWFVKTLLKGQYSYRELEGAENFEKDAPVFLPFLFGERCPGWISSRKGGFVKIDGSHEKEDFYRGVQMGVLFNMYQCYKIMVEENGTPSEVIVSGGICNSPRWLKMAADIFEREILVTDYPNASLMGAVALALHAAGELKDINQFKADYDSAVSVNCNPEHFDYYRRQYKRYIDAYNEVQI